LKQIILENKSSESNVMATEKYCSQLREGAIQKCVRRRTVNSFILQKAAQE
jgi:hypothetical protein